MKDTLGVKKSCLFMRGKKGFLSFDIICHIRWQHEDLLSLQLDQKHLSCRKDGVMEFCKFPKDLCVCV
jgi:hypothetical protein